VDAEMVARRAELVELATTAYGDFGKNGMMLENDSGNLYPNPALGIHSRATAEIRLLDKALGLTAPQTRISAKPPEATGYGRWAKLLSGGEEEPQRIGTKRPGTAARLAGGDDA
jgi:hypothetical protein